MLTSLEDSDTGQVKLTVDDGSGVVTLDFYPEPEDLNWAHTRASLL